MVAILTGQMYPGDKLLAKIAGLQARQNNKIEPETIFAAACGCSMMALSGAAHGMTNSLGGIERLYNLYAAVKHGFLETYKLEVKTAIDAEDLRTRFENASHKIARAGIENPTSAGGASAWQCARMAWLIIDPVESHLDKNKIAIFDHFIKQKYQTARGFFNVLRDNKMLLPP
jgi:hypothetical protein